ncbi:MAG: DUF2017 family protein [Actinomycetota bacterium]
MAIRHRIVRSSGGGFDLRIPRSERNVLRELPDQLRLLLDEGDAQDPALQRLFPSAYPDDPVAAAEFDGFVRDDLTEQRMKAIGTMARTIDSAHLDEEEALAWLAAVNDLRLVLGIRLAVTEESEPEDFVGDEGTHGSYALYAYLSVLEEDIVEALSGRPPASP